MNRGWAKALQHWGDKLPNLSEAAGTSRICSSLLTFELKPSPKQVQNKFKRNMQRTGGSNALCLPEHRGAGAKLVLCANVHDWAAVLHHSRACEAWVFPNKTAVPCQNVECGAGLWSSAAWMDFLSRISWSLPGQVWQRS